MENNPLAQATEMLLCKWKASHLSEHLILRGALWTKPGFLISVQKPVARVDSRQASKASSLPGNIACGEIIRRIGDTFLSFKTNAPN